MPDELAWKALAPADGPSAREDQTWTVDARAGIAYLFGGRAGGEALADLWAYDLALGTWTQLAPNGPGPQARFGHVAVWDEAGGLLVWSGQHDASKFFDDIWRYDPVENVWQELSGEGDRPLARYGSCGAISPEGDLWVSHGFTSDGRFDDTHSFDVAGAGWSDVTPSGEVPVERCLHDCFFSTEGLFVLYGGQTNGVAALGDLWYFDPATATWTEESGPASARQLYALAVMRDEAYVFGGAGVDGGFLDDLWRIDRFALGWATAAPAGGPPPPRSGATLIADEPRGRLLLFGGKNGDGELADLWQLGAP